MTTVEMATALQETANLLEARRMALICWLAESAINGDPLMLSCLSCELSYTVDLTAWSRCPYCGAVVFEAAL